MIIFITIVFIAELIIAGAIVGLIVKIDRRVNCINNQLTSAMPLIESGLCTLHNGILNLKKTLYNILCIIEKKKKTYTLKIVKTALLYLILVFCKNKYKKAAGIFQLVLLVSEYMDKLPFNTCNPSKIMV